MSYILNKTNGSIIATVQDATIDLTTDLIFLGRNYAGYGESQNENFIKLLENFANTSAPTKPLEGELWYDTKNKHINVYDNVEWKSIANLEVSDTNPLNVNNPPTAGNLWYNPVAEQLYASNGDIYVLIGPPSGADTKAGWRGDFEHDAAQPDPNIYNIKAVIGSEIVATVSNQEYTVAERNDSSYPIFDSVNNPRLHKGINLRGADAVTGSSEAEGVYLWGTAAHAMNANTATTSGATNFTVSAENIYQPVPFLTTATTGRATVNVDYGFTYNASTHYVKATRFEGVATSALYADLAERYEADAVYDFGTVVVIGGDKEVTTTDQRANTAVAGIVSKNPAYMMNSEAGTDETHPYIALKGRVPCKVVGNVNKGDLLVSSVYPGYAASWVHGDSPNAVIGKALGSNSSGFEIIEVLVV